MTADEADGRYFHRQGNRIMWQPDRGDPVFYGREISWEISAGYVWIGWRFEGHPSEASLQVGFGPLTIYLWWAR